MTDTLIDHTDSGEIPRLPGEDRTVIIRIDTGEATQRIDPRLIKAPSFDAIPRKVIEIDDTVTFHIPETIGCVDLEGPQKPPPPLPKPKLLGMVAGLDGELRPAPPQLRRSVPYVMPADRAPFAGPRHAAPAPAWTKWAIGVGALLTVWAVVVLAVFL